MPATNSPCLLLVLPLVLVIIMNAQVGASVVVLRDTTQHQDATKLLLTKSIIAMSAFDATLRTLLSSSASDIKPVVKNVAALYIIKSEIEAVHYDTTEVQLITTILDIALNDSCLWLISKTQDMFICTPERIKWMHMKFQAAEAVQNTVSSLMDATTTKVFDTCAWANQHLFCIDDSPIKEFVEANKIMGHCRPQRC